MRAVATAVLAISLLGLLLIQAVLGDFYIPKTTIGDESSFYQLASENWDGIRDQIDSRISSYADEEKYGVYVLMTSIYGGEELPNQYDDDYMHALMSKFEELGGRTWDEKELQSISSTYVEDCDADDGSSSGGSDHDTTSAAATALYGRGFLRPLAATTLGAALGLLLLL